MPCKSDVVPFSPVLCDSFSTYDILRGRKRTKDPQDLRKELPMDKKDLPTTPSYEIHKDPRNPDTVGIVIGNLDPTLREALGFSEDCSSVGIVTSKRSSLKNIFGADEAIK